MGTRRSASFSRQRFDVSGYYQPTCVLPRRVRRWRFSGAVISLLFGLQFAGGCAYSADTVAVGGKVSYRGEPVTNASVTFFPPSGRPVSAALSEAGEYEIDLPP